MEKDQEGVSMPRCSEKYLSLAAFQKTHFSEPA